MYDETSYKIYKYVNINDIEILITPSERMDDINKKYKMLTDTFYKKKR